MVLTSLTGSGNTDWSVTLAYVDALKSKCEVKFQFTEATAGANSATYVANIDANAASTFTAYMAK